jgi:glycine cleavage system H protein
MEIRESMKYTKEHEWVQKLDENFILGITDFAQNALGDIVFVELPQLGNKINKGQSIGVIESIKSVSDLYTPVSGKVTEINDELAAHPERLNKSPYESWIVKIEGSNASEYNALMSAEEYRIYCEESH